MIYRVVVDEREEFRRARMAFRLKRDAGRTLGKYLPRKYAARVDALEGQIFRKQEQLVEALQLLVGLRRYSLLAPHVSTQIEISYMETINGTAEWPDQADRGRTGAGFGFLADVMVEHGMIGPDIRNERARFYFTEKGWQAVGRYVAAEAKRNGHHVQVLKQKNPEASQIVYADDLQVAILPARSSKSGDVKRQDR
jgi:hypothetical protein